MNLNIFESIKPASRLSVKINSPEDATILAQRWTGYILEGLKDGSGRKFHLRLLASDSLDSFFSSPHVQEPTDAVRQAVDELLAVVFGIPQVTGEADCSHVSKKWLDVVKNAAIALLEAKDADEEVRKQEQELGRLAMMVAKDWDLNLKISSKAKMQAEVQRHAYARKEEESKVAYQETLVFFSMIQILQKSVGKLEVQKLSTLKNIAQLTTSLQEAMSSLNQYVKERCRGQRSMEDNAQVVQNEIQQQKHDLTQQRIDLELEKSTLNTERAGLLRKLAQVDNRMQALSVKMSTLENQERNLSSTLSTVKSQFDNSIQHSINEQKRLADSKMNSCSLLSLAQLTQDVYEAQFTRQHDLFMKRLRQKSNQLAHSMVRHIEVQRNLFHTIRDGGFSSEYMAVFDASWKDTTNLALRVMMVLGEPTEGNDEGKNASSQFKPGDVVEAKWRGTPSGYYLCEIHAIENNEAIVSWLRPRPDGLYAGSKTVMEVEGDELSCRQVPLSSIRNIQEQEDTVPPDTTKEFFRQQALVAKNTKCVDCGADLDRPWASISLAIYLCLACAGEHRGLGTHLSFVRSTSMDEWTQKDLDRMGRGGNESFLKFISPYPEFRAMPVVTKYATNLAHWRRRHLDEDSDEQHAKHGKQDEQIEHAKQSEQDEQSKQSEHAEQSEQDEQSALDEQSKQIEHANDDDDGETSDKCKRAKGDECEEGNGHKVTGRNAAALQPHQQDERQQSEIRYALNVLTAEYNATKALVVERN